MKLLTSILWLLWPFVLSGAAAQVQPRFKGIWEPVSYKADVKLFDVFFATALDGWAAGGTTEIRGGVLLHTSDGGDHWVVQYGDPQSSDRAVRNLRFLDTTHGWAMQGTGSAAHLLHTADGQNWNLAGTIAEHTVDYMFISESTGVAVGSSDIARTTDGGRTWKNVAACATTAQVEGLARNVRCEWTRLQFINPSIAYAIGFNRQLRTTAFVARSSDAGASWTLTAATVSDTPQDGFFLDENTGYIRTGAPDTGQIFKTTDGGNTWVGMAASPGARIQFADPEVGWAVLYNKVSFTTDSGNRWNSRQYPFPARVNAFSLPRRDRGYVVGEHGMIYRYRIVPESYTAQGLIPAPLLSGIDSPLNTQVDQLAQQVQKLAQDAGLPATSFSQDASSGFTQSSADSSFTQGSAAAGFGSESAGGSAFPTSAGTGGCVGLATGQAVQPGTASAMPASTPSGGFVQDTGTGATGGAGGGGFVQDTSTASATFDQVSTATPQFVTKYKNLNLLFTGFQMSSQIPATVTCLKQAFQSLKATKNPQAATALISGIQANVIGLRQMVRNAFQVPKLSR